MKKRYSLPIIATIAGITIGFVSITQAATTPSLGQAASFAILSSTYTNTVSGTTLTGDLGYSTGPALAPTVSGTTSTPPAAAYTTAGTDQAAALASLASQPCTHTFPAGAIDLATDTSHGTIGVYSPGVYCTTASSAASIGTAGIALTGSGTYIFRIDGALTTVANSVVSLAGSASACDVFWTPTGATTLGANSTFVGTNIDAAGITIGSTVNWVGRALAFGGTVSTTSDTIAIPTCAAAITNTNTTVTNTNTTVTNTNTTVTNTNTVVSNTNTTVNTNAAIVQSGATNSTPQLPSTGVKPETSRLVFWFVLGLLSLGTTLGVTAFVVASQKK